MFGVEAPYVQVVQEPHLSFDLQKVQQVYDNYAVNYHAGLTMVMGHPFIDEKFCQGIREEQEVIQAVFAMYQLEDVLVLYDVDSQVHATLVELASQHDTNRNDQQLLEENELSISSKSKQLMNINYAIRWIQTVEPFDIELGPNVLSEAHADQTLRITDSGQVVMKGRPKDRKLLADIRAEFEDKAGIIHKYGKEDDEFFFVIGYLKPDPRLLNPEFRFALETCINSRRPNVQLALKVDRVKMIMYQNYSLDEQACLWESRDFKFSEKPDLPGENLIDTVIDLIKERQLFTGQRAG